MKKIYYTLAAVLLLVLAGVFYFLDPATSDLFPACLFHKYTGLLCPGCGSQRAIHAILNGRFSEAAHYNLLLVLSLPFLGAYLLYMVRGTLSEKKQREFFTLHPLLRRLMFVVVISYWVIRNI